MYNMKKNKLLGDYYMYRPSTYKIYIFYKLSFEALYYILRKDKDVLTETLLYEYYGGEFIKNKDLYSFNELIVEMIKNLAEKEKEIGLAEIKKDLMGSERIIRLKQLYKQRNLPHKSSNISFRFSPEVKKTVQQLKQKRIGEIIELAISLYIETVDPKTYKLLLKTFAYDK